MATYKAKTTETQNSVAGFINKLAKERQADCLKLVDIFSASSGFEAKMWGPAIIGFGSYHYVYDSGHEGDAPLVGFSPRKNEFALYIANFEGKEELLSKLGKHKTAKSCVYIKKLEEVNTAVLKQLITGSKRHTRNKYK